MARPPAKIEEEEQDERLTVEALEPLFRPEKREVGVKMAMTIVARSHRGPLPDPETYAGYEHVLPGSAERILRMAEREQEHRHVSESRLIWHEYGIRYSSQVGAVLALMLLCGLVAFCTKMGQPVPAAVISAVGAVVIGFLGYTQLKRGAQDKDEPATAKKTTSRRKR